MLRGHLGTVCLSIKEFYDVSNPLELASSFLDSASSDTSIADTLALFHATITGALEEFDIKLSKITLKMPKESKSFYYKEVDRINKIAKNYSPAIANLYEKELLSFFISLLVHTLFKSAVGLTKKGTGTEDLDPLLFRFFLFGVFDSISLLVNRQRLKELAKQAQDGNDEALFKIAKVDKSLFEHDWVKQRINKATYSEDKVFFQKLAKHMKEDPLANKFQSHGTRLLVLLMFWPLGLFRLTAEERHALLSESDSSLDVDLDNYIKFEKRYVLPIVRSI